MTRPRPALARLRAAPGRHLRALRLSALRRAAVDALAIQLLLAPGFALAAAFRPDEPAWLIAVAATWCLWLRPLLHGIPLLFGTRERDEDVAAAALDRLNPDAPDVYRTARRPGTRDPETLDALETLFVAWEPRLRPAPAKHALTPRSFRRRALGFAALCAVLAFLAPLLSPERLGPPGAVATRALLPLRVLGEIPAPRLAIIALPAAVARGDSVTALVRIDHVPRRRPVRVLVRMEEGGDETRHDLDRSGTGDTARIRLGPITRNLSLRFVTRGYRTEERRVRVVFPPRLKRLTAVATPPAYTGLPRERHPDVPPVLSVFPGTRIEWEGTADGPLRAATVLWDGPRERGPDDGTVKKEGRGGRFAFFRVVRDPVAFSLRLVGREPFDAPAVAVEGPWRVELRRDEPPEAVLIAPAGDGSLARTLRVGLRFRVADDFGVSRVLLHHAVRARDGSVRVAGVSDLSTWPRAADGAAAGGWDASPLRPEPGETVELFLEAFDNDEVTGPHASRSAVARLRLPTAEELREAVTQGTRGAETGLASAAERARLAQRELDRAEAPDRAASGELASMASEWEVRRILVDEPRRILTELERQLGREVDAARAAGAAPAPKPPGDGGDERRAPETLDALDALHTLKADVSRRERRLPSPRIATAPSEEQRRAAETLAREQADLATRLERTPPPAAETARGGPSLKENRRRLEDALARNAQEQNELRAFLEERARADAARRERLEAAARHAEEASRDVRAALEDIREAIRAGIEDGSLDEDVVEKMDRVRELLEETMDAEDRARMTRASDESPARGEELRKALRDFRERKDGLRDDLDRAIRMLEQLAERRALAEAAEEIRTLERDQGALARDMDAMESTMESAVDSKAAAPAGDSGRAAPDLARAQDSLAARLEETMRTIQSLRSVQERSGEDASEPRDPRAGHGADREPEKARDGKAGQRKGNPLDEARREAREARADMERSRRALRAPRPDPAAARRSAERAAQGLKRAAARMDQVLAQGARADAMAEVHAVLEETLEMTRWVEGRSNSAASPPDPAAAARVADWLSRRMLRLADARPYETDVLRREASALSVSSARAAALAAADGGRWPDSVRIGLVMTARRAARELLKWQNQPPDGGGDQPGDGGAGETDAGGGEHGQAGREGQDGHDASLSGRLRGVSGRQMDANRMTQELLRSMLRERTPQPGGSSPGGGRASDAPPSPGSSGSSASSASSGASSPSSSGAGERDGRQGRAGGENGGETAETGARGAAPGSAAGSSASSGASGPSGTSGAPASNAAANAQQSVSELLETMAEAAEDGGGAARRLRELAAEARALERELRGPRLDPAEVRARQARFQARLLETADALEERGMRSERRAETFIGPLPAPDAAHVPVSDGGAEELKRRREEARALPLTSPQKRHVEWYYDELEGLGGRRNVPGPAETADESAPE